MQQPMAVGRVSVFGVMPFLDAKRTVRWVDVRAVVVVMVMVILISMLIFDVGRHSPA